MRQLSLRQLVEDAELLRGASPRGQEWTMDPTTTIAEHKILHAQRRGVFDKLAKGKPLPEAVSYDRSEQASVLMAKQMAAANVKPRSIELRLECEATREALRDRIRATPDPGACAALRSAAAALDALIRRQHLAAIADAHAFSSKAATSLQVPTFDLDAEIQKGKKLPDDDDDD